MYQLTIWAFTYLLLLGSSILAYAQDEVAPTENRLALVIGNSNYVVSPLPNPLNDAHDITAALKRYGFEVMLILDGDLVAIESAIDEFGRRLRGGGVGLFYYSGHGVQNQGRNYLVPIGAIKSIKSAFQLRYRAVDVGYLLGAMQDAGNRLNIVMLDACRDNPFRGFSRNLNSGLARIDGAEGMLISYSTAPGKVAYDGDGRNSPYTTSLLQLMDTPNLPIELLLKKVRTAVRQETDGAQTPWYEASIDGNFAFNIKIQLDPSDYSLNISGNIQQQPTPNTQQHVNPAPLFTLPPTASSTPQSQSKSDELTPPPTPDPVQRGQLLAKEWEHVRHTNSVAAYDRFIRAHPFSPWHEQAVYYRDQAALKQARAAKTVAAYDHFINTYPHSSWQATAVYERDKLAFEEARNNGTLAAFLRRYPDSQWREQAEYYLRLYGN